MLVTTLQTQGKDPGQRDTTKNHGRLGGIRQTPGYLQKQPCHLPEETGVQLLCAEKTRETSQAVERRPGQILSDTIWQRTAQDRVIWRRHAEAFAQPRDTTAA